MPCKKPTGQFGGKRGTYRRHECLRDSFGGIQGSSVSEKFAKPNWARYLCATSTGDDKLISGQLVLE